MLSLKKKQKKKRHYEYFVLSCRQNKLEEALLFSGQFTDALQALIDWLYRVEPQLAEDQPVHGDIDLVLNLIDSHKVQSFNPNTSIGQFVTRVAKNQNPASLLQCRNFSLS